MIAMANERLGKTRQPQVRRRAPADDYALDLAPDDAARLRKVQARWENKDARWAVDPVYALCVALLTNAAQDAKRLQNAADALLKAREKARKPLERLDIAVRRFARAVAETKDGVRWILDEPSIAPAAAIVSLGTEAIQERVLANLDGNLAKLVSGRGGACPMCGRR